MPDTTTPAEVPTLSERLEAEAKRQALIAASPGRSTRILNALEGKNV